MATLSLQIDRVIESPDGKTRGIMINGVYHPILKIKGKQGDRFTKQPVRVSLILEVKGPIKGSCPRCMPYLVPTRKRYKADDPSKPNFPLHDHCRHWLAPIIDGGNRDLEGHKPKDFNNYLSDMKQKYIPPILSDTIPKSHQLLVRDGKVQLKDIWDTSGTVPRLKTLKELGYSTGILKMKEIKTLKEQKQIEADKKKTKAIFADIHKHNKLIKALNEGKYEDVPFWAISTMNKAVPIMGLQRGWGTKFAEGDQIDAMILWKDVAFAREMNQYLSGDGLTPLPELPLFKDLPKSTGDFLYEEWELKKHISSVDKLISKYGSQADKPITLWRAIEGMTPEGAKQMVGTTITDPRYISTSTSKKVAESYLAREPGVMVQVLVDEDSGARFIPVDNFFYQGKEPENWPANEEEVLIQRNQKYRVVDYNEKHNVLTVHLEKEKIPKVKTKKTYPTIADPPDRKKFVEVFPSEVQDHGWGEGMQQHLRNSLEYYKDVGYRAMNDFLVDGSDADLMEEEIDNIDAIFDKYGVNIPSKMILWRGISGVSVEDWEAMVGTIHTEPRYMSSSTDKSKATEFGDSGVLLKVFADPDVTDARAIAVENLYRHRSFGLHELEILWERGSRFKVLEVNRIENAHHSEPKAEVVVQMVAQETVKAAPRVIPSAPKAIGKVKKITKTLAQKIRATFKKKMTEQGLGESEEVLSKREHQKHIKEIEKLREEYNVVDMMPEHKIPKEYRAKLRKEIDRFRMANSERQRIAMESRQATFNEFEKELTFMIPEKDQIHFSLQDRSVQETGALSDVITDRAWKKNSMKDAVKWIQNKVSSGHFHAKAFLVSDTEPLNHGRSYARGSRIFLDDKDANSPATVLHEVGHVIENTNPAIHRAAIDFLHKRTAAQKEEKLKDLLPHKNYDDDEVAIPDKFFRPYVGKIYPHRATEIISMGLEYMYRNPLQFALDDPEHFTLIRKVMNGEIG